MKKGLDHRRNPEKHQILKQKLWCDWSRESVTSMEARRIEWRCSDLVFSSHLSSLTSSDFIFRFFSNLNTSSLFYFSLFKLTFCLPHAPVPTSHPSFSPSLVFACLSHTWISFILFRNDVRDVRSKGENTMKTWTLRWWTTMERRLQSSEPAEYRRSMQQR